MRAVLITNKTCFVILLSEWIMKSSILELENPLNYKTYDMSSLQITFLQIGHPTKDTCKMLTICILKNYNIRETVAAAPRWGPGGRGGPHTWWWAGGTILLLRGRRWLSSRFSWRLEPSQFHRIFCTFFRQTKDFRFLLLCHHNIA